LHALCAPRLIKKHELPTIRAVIGLRICLANSAAERSYGADWPAKHRTMSLGDPRREIERAGALRHPPIFSALPVYAPIGIFDALSTAGVGG
jgi:hypothetical protein